MTATKYYEVDLPSVVKRKIRSISKSEVLKEPLGDGAKVTANSIDSVSYALVSADLRDVEDLDRKLKGVAIDFALPTLFISECVLIYLEPESSDAIIKWAGDNFKTGGFLTYEQIRPHDSFGIIMIRNLQSRGCDLRSITLYPDVTSQEKRYTSRGWVGAKCVDMNEIYYKVIDQEDVRRIAKLEMFDEFEEWHLISAHYCFTMAVNDELGVFNDVSFFSS